MSAKGNSGRRSTVRMGGRAGRSTGFVVAFLGILLGASTGLHAQGVRYDNIVLGPRGGPVASATVVVCSAGATTSTTPCSPLATIYSDEGLTQPMANPFQADSLGNYGFWAAPGHYIVQIYGTGVSTKVMNVFLPCDPSDCSMANATFSSITAGTLNLTGSLTVNGRGVATKPLAGDAVMYISPNGNDSNDGLSWGTAKQTLYAAFQAIEAQASNSGYQGGTIYVADGVSCGGPVAGQGLWIYRTGSSPGAGWLQMTSPVSIIGVGTTHWGSNQSQGLVALNCGSATQPGLELQGINVPLYFKNLGFSGSVAANLIGGVTTVRFDNDAFWANDSNATNGPAVLIGSASFWIYFHHCLFQANDNAGKATDGSDATEALVVTPGSANPSAGLIFVEDSIERNGSLKFSLGNTSASLFVDGLSTENQTDGKGAVWLPAAGGLLTANVKNINVSDAVINPTPAIEVDSGSADNVFVSGVQGYGQNTTGPMTVLGWYGNEEQNFTELPLVQGNPSPWNGKSFYMSDAGRRTFSPVATAWSNLAKQLPSAWTKDSYVTVTAVAAPDGTTNAGQLSNTNTSGDDAIFYDQNTNLASGDYLVFGYWEKGDTGNMLTVDAAPQGCSGITTTSVLPSVETNQYVGGQASGEWEWYSHVLKISGSNAACEVKFSGRVDGSVSSNGPVYFAPVFYHIPTGTVADSEAAMIGLNLAPYPDSISPPVESTLRGHPFAFGGSGDDYLATLDHTALTANRTYTLPDSAGTICVANAGTSGCGSTSGTVHVTSATTDFGTAISNTSLVSSSQSGTYTVSAYAVQETAGVGCSSTGNSATLYIDYTGPTGLGPQAATVTLNETGNGAVGTNANGVTEFATQPGTAIYYSIASTLNSTGCTTAPQYAFYLQVIY